MKWNVEIHHLFVSEGHRFAGRHGKEPLQFPMTDRPTIECVAGKGIVGDRYFDYKPDYKGQLTFFSADAFRQIQSDLGVDDKDASVFRRNVVLSGVDLNELIGVQFSLGDVDFEGVEEARPCYWMNQAFCPGAEEWLRGKGGLRVRILTDGEIEVGQHQLALLK